MSSILDAANKRRFPRIDYVASEQIIRISSDQTPRQNVILTQNVSASGIKFTTAEEFLPNSDFLLYLNPQLIPELGHDATQWVRAGDHYLARVVWVKRIDGKSLYEVGATFADKSTCRADAIQKLTELLNVSMLQRLPLHVHDAV